jgi:hypothetical protein
VEDVATECSESEERLLKAAHAARKAESRRIGVVSGDVRLSQKRRQTVHRSERKVLLRRER